MRPDEVLGWLGISALFGLILYLSGQILWELVTGRGTSRRDTAAAFRKDPLGSLLKLAFFLVSTTFFGVISVGPWIFPKGRSDFFLWLLALLIALGAILAFRPRR